MQDDEIITFEDRTYQSPTVSRDSQLEFIDTLRNVMGQKQNEVNASTYALGSQLPSNLGGLRGGEQTFEARYRTPQLEQTAANLRTAAQQSALNTALSNLQAAYKKRYNDAVLNYQKRAAVSSTTPTSGGQGSGLPINTNNQGETGVKTGGQTEAQKQLDTAQTNAQTWGADQTGSQLGNNATVIMYKVDGTPQYATVYRGPRNEFLGVETPTGSFNAAYGQNFLNQLEKAGNLFNAGGTPLNAINLFTGLSGL